MEIAKPRRTVRAARAMATEQPLIEGLARFYVYDFSEMEPADSDDLDFDANGAHGALPHLADYWIDPDRHPLVIRLGEKPAGFALINTFSHRGGAVERNMSEFFVARHRGSCSSPRTRRSLRHRPRLSPRQSC
jgi:hypothetical protein